MLRYQGCKHTHTYCFFESWMVTRTRLRVTSYMHCLSCSAYWPVWIPTTNRANVYSRGSAGRSVNRVSTDAEFLCWEMSLVSVAGRCGLHPFWAFSPWHKKVGRKIRLQRICIGRVAFSEWSKRKIGGGPIVLVPCTSDVTCAFEFI